MKERAIRNDRPIAIYNANKQELMGLFQTPSILTRYIYGRNDFSKDGQVYSCLKRKGKIHDTIFDFPVAVRYASNAQLERIGDLEYIIENDYPEPVFFLRGAKEKRYH